MERRLAAILTADVVGYSRLMGKNEARTLAALRHHRETLIAPTAARHRGRIVKLMGDGALMEFASIVDAVVFALDVQFAMRDHNRDLPEDQVLRFRIGINIGDVIADGDDVYGDGVNVAARLEGLAEPGGICISRNVRNQIRDKLDVNLEDLGEVEVKNIARPVRAFRIHLDDRAEAVVSLLAATSPKRVQRSWPVAIAAPMAAIAIAGAVGWYALSLPRHDTTVTVSMVPSAELETAVSQVPPVAWTPEGRESRLTVAILPFTNVSEYAGEEWLGDGIAEDIMTAVSRFRDMTVIARNSSFRFRGEAIDPRQIGRELNADFLLQGSVRRSGDRLRITSQLVDARTGESRWTERFDRPFHDVFAIQDEIAESVAGTLVAHAREATVARIRAQPPENLEAYELVLRARKAYNSFTHEGVREGRALLERAVEIDPEYAGAWELLARMLIQFFIQPYDESQGDFAVVRAARAAAEKAVMLDPNLSTVHATLGWTLTFSTEYDASLEALRTALSINPNDADSVRTYATTLGQAGLFREALDAWEEAMRLDPFFPTIAYALRAKDHVMLGEHDKALPLARTCAERAPRLMPCFTFFAIAANELGQAEEAHAAAQRILELDPNYSIARHLRIIRYAKAEDAARFAEYLRRVGLPE